MKLYLKQKRGKRKRKRGGGESGEGKEIRSEYLEKQKSSKNYLFENLPEDMARHMEDVRLGYTDFDKE